MLLISMLLAHRLQGATTHLFSHRRNPSRLTETREQMMVASLQDDDDAGLQRNRMTPIDYPLHEAL